MSEIVLTTLNARYWHSSFGLRYLLANMGELQSQTVLIEFGINDRPIDVVARILEYQPRVVGLGVYIWNVDVATRLVADLKRVAPDVLVVLGGPEVSYETEEQEICQLADYVITGEGDLAFAELCHKLLAGMRPPEKVLAAPLPVFQQLRLAYPYYTDEDIQHRVIYVEASRGCPFTCEFCLSSLEIPVRLVKLDSFLSEMDSLLDRGALQFKFVDRTFNLNLRVSGAILRFFLERFRPGLFLHFEMIPDRLPEPLRELIRKFPPGTLQFEIGVQTFNEEVSRRISRPQDNSKLEENFEFLRQETGVHLHADLIVGLPGETLESFAAGFDRLVALDPQEIQVGILKRLRGTPIVRHDDSWEMVYSPSPPYEILRNRDLDFPTLNRLRRLARFWDLVANSGNFVESRRLIWAGGRSPFWSFLEFSDWLITTESRTHGIPLVRLAQRVFEFITTVAGVEPEVAAEAIWNDYTRGGREDRPVFLRPFDLPVPVKRAPRASELPARQHRHNADRIPTDM